MLTLWGYDAGQQHYDWSDNKGAAGYEGATLTVGSANGAATIVTFAGLSSANTSLDVSTGLAGSTPYLAVTRLA